MKKVLLVLITYALCIMNCAWSQNSLVSSWDKVFGGTNLDWFRTVEQTRDGGFILAGYSWSEISGNKTQDPWGGLGDNDYWIVKTDSQGNKEWDMTFGGTYYEFLYSVKQTNDGGFIIAGSSGSGIGGSKTQASWGGWDYWIVKTDSVGNKQWDKRFGGIEDDWLYSVQQTADGGFILGGYSYSGMGGNKSQALRGGAGDSDYWIVKIDSLGNVQWDKDFGGTYFESFASIQQTSDGGYILGGTSQSIVSGDRTAASRGVTDYWILKTDSLGNKQWDKAFGGNSADGLFSLQQSADGGYILGGSCQSGISGDKTQSNWDSTELSNDYWIVKTDSLGIKQWDKRFGGNDHEDLQRISQTTDGGYLISGDSFSPISGNKTQNNLGSGQVWVVKTDLHGNLLWERTLLTTRQGRQGMAIETRDGCYVVANLNDGAIAGDKTQPHWWSTDYWIIKLCDTMQFPVSDFAAPSTHICPGTCINFLNLSLFPASYQWFFPGATPDTSTAVTPTNICYANPGTYDVQLIGSNTIGSDTLVLNDYITVYPQPAPQFIMQSGDTLYANAGATSYQWNYFGNTIPGATDYFYVATQSGNYSVVAADENDCEVEAVINNVLASAQSAVRPGSYREQLAIYPNPVQDKFTIHNAQFTPDSYRDGKTAEISIYNMIGALAFPPQSSHLNPGTSIDVSGLTKGIYWLEINAGEKTVRLKFVKQ